MGSRRMGLVVLIGVAGLLCFSLILNADPPRPAPEQDSATVSQERITVSEARQRGRLLHKVYAATLDAMHHRYFRSDHAVLPARAMEDVFDEIDEQAKIKSRWIAVNTPAMSTSHQPKDEFEKKAAAELAAGKSEYESIEGGFYRRAGAIPLKSGCVGCHTRFGQNAVKSPRFAGLVISIPVEGR